jgi:hypothetical protein
MDSVVIAQRFNGPPDSGNGGYTCGLLARFVEGPAVVSLRKPPPLEREPRVEGDGERMLLLDGDELVAEAALGESMPAGDPPPPVSVDTARAAEDGAFFRDAVHHPFPTCFVCGPRRSEGDGLRIFAGSVGDGVFASTWTPPASVADGDGSVPSEIVWSALDCPTSAPGMNRPDAEGNLLPIVLARLAVDARAPVEPEAAHVVMSWDLGRDGRKRHAGAALFSAGGELLASARALWIELRSAA